MSASIPECLSKTVSDRREQFTISADVDTISAGIRRLRNPWRSFDHVHGHYDRGHSAGQHQVGVFYFNSEMFSEMFVDSDSGNAPIIDVLLLPLQGLSLFNKMGYVTQMQVSEIWAASSIGYKNRLEVRAQSSAETLKGDLELESAVVNVVGSIDLMMPTCGANSH